MNEYTAVFTRIQRRGSSAGTGAGYSPRLLREVGRKLFSRPCSILTSASPLQLQLQLQLCFAGCRLMPAHLAQLSGTRGPHPVRQRLERYRQPPRRLRCPTPSREIHCLSPYFLCVLLPLRTVLSVSDSCSPALLNCTRRCTHFFQLTSTFIPS